MFDTIDIDNLEIPDVIDDEFLEFDDNIVPRNYPSNFNFKFNSNSNSNSSSITLNPLKSFNSNLSVENNHISVLNSSTFNLSFQLLYTLDQENFIIDSGIFSPLYTRQIPFEKDSSHLCLIIKSIDSIKNETIIYNSSFLISDNYAFVVSGNLNNPIVSKK